MRFRTYIVCRVVKINDKHFEIIVRQMMRKVRIDDPGDTTFLEQELIDKLDFAERMIVSGVRRLLPIQVILRTAIRVRSSQYVSCVMRTQVLSAVTSSSFRCVMLFRLLLPQILQGITRAALGTKSFMSAASFQETTKVLNEAAIPWKGRPPRRYERKRYPVDTSYLPVLVSVSGNASSLALKKSTTACKPTAKNVIDYSEKEAATQE